MFSFSSFLYMRWKKISNSLILCVVHVCKADAPYTTRTRRACIFEVSNLFTRETHALVVLVVVVVVKANKLLICVAHEFCPLHCANLLYERFDFTYMEWTWSIFLVARIYIVIIICICKILSIQICACIRRLFKHFLRIFYTHIHTHKGYARGAGKCRNHNVRITLCNERAEFVMRTCHSTRKDKSFSVYYGK